MPLNTTNRSIKDTFKAIFTVLPSTILIGIFVYGFIINTILTSLTDWGRKASLAINPPKNFIGLENYKNLFTGLIHEVFRQDLVNAIFYSFFMVLGTLLLGLFFAILLDRTIKMESLFRTIFLYPMALSFVVSGTIWRWLLAPSGGINLFPRIFGQEPWNFLWISSKNSILKFNWQNIPLILFSIGGIIALFFLLRGFRFKNKKMIKNGTIGIVISLIYILIIHRFLPPILKNEEIHGFNLATIGILIAGIWQYSGYTMALYLAGLRSIPEGIRESAKIDGANEFIYYWKIAIPNIKPITLSAVIILAHISLKLFDLIFTMAGADNVTTGHPSIRMYLTTFRANNFAEGSAIAVILFILAALFIIPYLINSHRDRRS